MNIISDPELRREIILDNYQNPNNRGLTNDSHYIKENTNNESCIDNLDIEMRVENDVITDIRFDGEACAISTSATSIMIKTLIGKTTTEARKILQNYDNMIMEKGYDSDILGELIVYDEIYKQPNRKTCALLPRNAIIKMLNRLDES
ncbi:MAG: SUF system NifU family Fe-S cluster assembly protein [Bacilli bacterium]|nr:SUF system NifU family Fe-S cluster assembly protein [Bacilli bacterium]